MRGWIKGEKLTGRRGSRGKERGRSEGREPLAYRLVYSNPRVVGFYRPLVELLNGIRARKVLDVGAGYGIAADLIRERVEEIFLLEVEEAMAERAAERLGHPHTHVIVGDASQLPFRDSVFDLVYFFDSLHHISRREESLAEAIRVLRPSGLLAIFDFDGSRLTTKVLRVMEALMGIPSKFYTPEEMSRILSGMSVRIESISRGRMGSYLILAKKIP